MNKMDKPKDDFAERYGIFLESARKELIRLYNGRYKDIDQRMFSRESTLFFVRLSKKNISDEELMDHGEKCAKEFFDHYSISALRERVYKTRFGW